MMDRGAARWRFEARFGLLGQGARQLTIAGRRYELAEVMTRLGIGFEGCRPLDGFALGPTHFAVRYYDADEQWVVAYEFDGEFRYLAETRVHVAEWVGEDALALGFTSEELDGRWTST